MVSNDSATIVSDTPSQRTALSLELVGLMLRSGGYDALQAQMIEGAMLVAVPSFHANEGREMTQSEYVSLRSAMGKAFREVFGIDVWEPVLAGVYSKHLSAMELSDLIRFYRTSSGAKVLRLQGTMTAEAAEEGKKLVEAHQEELMGALGRELDNQ